MSNRMKIKDPSAKKRKKGCYVVSQEALERAHRFLDNLRTKFTFVANVGVERLERSVYNMVRTVEEEELLGNRTLIKELDNLLYAVKKLVAHLREHGKRYRLATSPWMSCYKEQYINESRVMGNIQNLARWECQGEYDELRAKAAKLAAIQKTLSPAISTEILISASWIRMVLGTYHAAAVEWRKHIGTEIAKHEEFFTLITHQLDDLNKVGERVNQALGQFRYDRNNPLWQEYHAVEDKLWLKLVRLDGNDEFNKKVVSYNVKDWVDFYLAHAMLETQDAGAFPAKVEKEIADIDAELAKQVRRMVNTIVKQVPETDDPFDFIDYLAEHKWRAYKALHNSVLNKVNSEQ